MSTLQSCKVDDNNVTRKNLKGMEVTSYWSNATKWTLLLGANRGFCFNAWLSATGEDQQQIEDRYFSNCKIRQESDNVWVLMQDNNLKYRIRTNGMLLSESNAEWTIVEYQPENPAYLHLVHNYADSVVAVVTNLGNMSWDIRLVMDNVISDEELYAHFTVTPQNGTIPVSLFSTVCAISGDGCYGFRTHIYSDSGEKPDEILNYIRFSLSVGTLSGNLAVSSYDNPADWTSGLLTLHVYADANAHEAGSPLEYYDEENIIADLSVHDGSQYADITMHGITETWFVEFPWVQPGGCLFFIPFW